MQNDYRLALYPLCWFITLLPRIPTITSAPVITAPVINLVYTKSMAKFGISKLSLRLFIYALILFTFCLGIPQFHYGVALMIFIIMKCKDNPSRLFAPVITLS